MVQQIIPYGTKDSTLQYTRRYTRRFFMVHKLNLIVNNLNLMVHKEVHKNVLYGTQVVPYGTQFVPYGTKDNT